VFLGFIQEDLLDALKGVSSFGISGEEACVKEVSTVGT